MLHFDNETLWYFGGRADLLTRLALVSPSLDWSGTCSLPGSHRRAERLLTDADHSRRAAVRKGLKLLLDLNNSIVSNL